MGSFATKTASRSGARPVSSRMARAPDSLPKVAIDDEPLPDPASCLAHRIPVALEAVDPDGHVKGPS